jgi:hypothetical protein
MYLWAGPGTIRMNRLKFMNAPVDELVHHEAYQAEGARRVVVETGCNWVYLTYNWGFPPEIEREDWETFRRAVEVFHAHGAQVFGYIQTSNYVYNGSFQQKDWYVRDRRGHPFYYYTGRYMACWLHPEWRNHLRTMVQEVITAGADGVFFDNPWYGAQPLYFGNTWLGSAGCFCERCRVAFRRATGLDIPVELDWRRDETRVYLRWRSDIVTSTLAEMAQFARALKPDVVVSVNDFDAVMRPSLIAFGIDMAALAQVQDIMMIEDYGLPRWESGRNNGSSWLVNTALTLRTARALVGTTPISTLPYDRGIGFDTVYNPRRFQQAIAEAAACGTVAVIKGTEFVETDGTFTLLTAAAYAPQREAIGRYHRWLETHANLYDAEHWENAAPIGILHPGDELVWRWTELASRYFGVAQTLTAAALPWRVVRTVAEGKDLAVLLDIGLAATEPSPPHPGRVTVASLPFWGDKKPPLLQRWPWGRRWTGGVLESLYRAYFERRWTRRLIDHMGLVHFFFQSPYFRLPPSPARAQLLEALGPIPGPRVHAEAPVLVELWRRRQDGQTALHLVNYAATPQTVAVTLTQPGHVRLLSPDSSESHAGWTDSLVIPLDVYTVLLIES